MIGDLNGAPYLQRHRSRYPQVARRSNHRRQKIATLGCHEDAPVEHRVEPAVDGRCIIQDLRIAERAIAQVVRRASKVHHGALTAPLALTDSTTNTGRADLHRHRWGGARNRRPWPKVCILSFDSESPDGVLRQTGRGYIQGGPTGHGRQFAGRGGGCPLNPSGKAPYAER